MWLSHRYFKQSTRQRVLASPQYSHDLLYPSALKLGAVPSKFRLDKLILQSFLLLLLYTLVGFCLAIVQVSPLLWGAIALMYHYNLANLQSAAIDPPIKSFLKFVCLISIASGITSLLNLTEPNLSILSAIAIALTTALTSLVMMPSLDRTVGRIRAVPAEVHRLLLIASLTLLACTGLFLGWAIEYSMSLN